MIIHRDQSTKARQEKSLLPTKASQNRSICAIPLKEQAANCQAHSRQAVNGSVGRSPLLTVSDGSLRLRWFLDWRTPVTDLEVSGDLQTAVPPT
jgi:hypothetical protein